MGVKVISVLSDRDLELKSGCKGNSAFERSGSGVEKWVQREFRF